MKVNLSKVAIAASFVFSSLGAASLGYALDVYPAVSCQNTMSPQSDGRIWNSGSTAWVKCGVRISDISTFDDDDLVVHYVEINSSTTTSGDFGCLVTTSALMGDSSYEYYSPFKYGCATAGGCTARVPGFTGAGNVRFDNIVRVGQDRVTIDCQIPASGQMFGYTYSS